jgi:hypothetical protein
MLVGQKGTGGLGFLCAQTRERGTPWHAPVLYLFLSQPNSTKKHAQTLGQKQSLNQKAQPRHYNVCVSQVSQACISV